MEKQNLRASVDELSLVKAAAWAWFQHGSGSDGKPMCEFDLTRFTNVPKPSRYKLQAIKQVQETTDSSGSALSVFNNSLLDKYEIERISRQLDSYIESSHAQHYGRLYAGDSDEKGTVVAVGESGSGIGMKSKQKKMKEISKGYFWFGHSVICGSRHDVVQNRSFGHRQRLQRREKHVPVAVSKGPVLKSRK
ncbi:unnamed protein product [Fraxinus pennsylvanica]|uniref:Uncharacterized protein n=1 Tax=Fraxinus pennsylvanica TaxID=56036 RepID=A0AAD2E6T2_9LAMI|nr:unnamed protein product [Fraxinus pennsylvanica]